MPKKKETKEVKKAPVKKPYHLEVLVNDIVFKTDAKSLEEALAKFVESPEFPVGAKTTAFVRFSKGKKEGKRLWHTPEARRMFRLIGLKPDALSLLAGKFEAELNS